jgi:hypothetical protein
MNLTRGEVLASHEQLLQDGVVHSVVPELTDIQIDPDIIVRILGNAVYGNFAHSGIGSAGLINHLRGSVFTFTGDCVDIHYVREPTDDQRYLAENAAETISPIDQHFRQLAGVPDEQPTEPVVNLHAGVFSGRAPSDTNRHFDFGARLPIIQYKMYYLGDPLHGSVYYPGNYRLPTRTQAVTKGAPYVPKPLFRPKDEERVSMPANSVCIEPWNAYHSGPTDKKARRTRRGILSVSYDLTRLSLSRRAAEAS